MTYVVALERDPTDEDERTWEIITLDTDPGTELGIEIGGQFEDDGLVWRVADIFR